MPNNINWMSVICSTWVGDEDNNTRAIPVASLPSCFSNAYSYADAYRTRVLADGGTVENYDCLVDAINELNYN